ncbi:MAG TPA: aspartate kinase [Gammaproteobacteria bacterium]|nr:aspartate kinase [Gammaproteobacteria bacterium]
MSSLSQHNLARDYGVEPVHLGASRRVLLLVGGHTGRVGAALLRLLGTEGPRLLAEHRVEFHLAGAVNRRAVHWRDPEAGWREDVIPRAGDDWRDIIRRFRGYLGPKLFVDCTASGEIAAHYREFFEQGIGVVTPNKLALSGPQKEYRELRTAAERLRLPYRYETTVGAALPLLSTLADLKASGDAVLRIEAVLSGTLSFLFQRLNHGLPFSAAVAEARAEGYTEPHPAEDLKAQDSARKLLILMREAGIAWEPERVRVKSLVPPDLADETDPERFLTRLAAYDANWAADMEQARKQGLRLACLAEFDGREARVGVTPVPAADPFAQVAAGENLLRVWTRRYQPVPLTIAGPGAGTEVTAAGLLTDLVKAVTGARRV